MSWGGGETAGIQLAGGRKLVLIAARQTFPFSPPACQLLYARFGENLSENKFLFLSVQLECVCIKASYWRVYVGRFSSSRQRLVTGECM